MPRAAVFGATAATAKLSEWLMAPTQPAGQQGRRPARKMGGAAPHRRRKAARAAWRPLANWRRRRSLAPRTHWASSGGRG